MRGITCYIGFRWVKTTKGKGKRVQGYARQLAALLFAMIWLAPGYSSASQVEKISVIAMPLKTSLQLSTENRRAVDLLILTESQRYPTINLLGESDISGMLGAEALKQMMGCNDTECWVEMSGALGADLILISEMGSIQPGRHFLTMTLLNSRSGEIKSRVRQALSSDLSDLENAVVDAFTQLMNDFVGPPSTSVHGWKAKELTGLLGVLRLPDGQIIPDISLSYAHSLIDSISIGLVAGIGQTEVIILWADLLEDYEEKVSLRCTRLGLVSRWMPYLGENGFTELMAPYLGLEVGLAWLSATSSAKDPPKWLPGTQETLDGIYASAFLGFRFFPRSTMGFFLEGGIRVLPDALAVYDRDQPLTNEKPQKIGSRKGVMDGPFALGGFRYGF